MADTRPTRVSPCRAIGLCILGIFAPSKLATAEQEDNRTRESFGERPKPSPNAFRVFHSFWTSLGLVLASTVAGYVAGRLTAAEWGIPPDRTVSGAQVFGAGLLLWGTLFVRGWEIQTFCGVTLTERVNQWIYRSLYCAGTGVLVWAVALAGMKAESAVQGPTSTDYPSLAIRLDTPACSFFAAVVGAVAGSLTTVLVQWLMRRDSYRQGAYTERAKAIQDLLEHARYVKDSCVRLHNREATVDDVETAKDELLRRGFYHEVWISEHRGVQSIREFNDAIKGLDVCDLPDRRAAERALEVPFERLRGALKEDLGFYPR